MTNISFQAEKEVMHWNKSVFHNFYQQGHDSEAHKNEKGRIVGKPYFKIISFSDHKIRLSVTTVIQKG